MQNAGAPLPSRRCSHGASRGNPHGVPGDCLCTCPP